MLHEALHDAFHPQLRNSLDTAPVAGALNSHLGTQAGVKHDDGKIMGQLLGDFSRALMGVANVGTFGAKKYTRGGWQTVPDGLQRYYDALWRHLLQANYEERDIESGLTHLEHAAWNILAVIELQKRTTKDQI